MSSTISAPIEALIPSDYWVSPGARVALAPGVREAGPRLDVAPSDHVELNAAGRLMAKDMTNGVAVHELATRLEDTFGLSATRAARDVRVFVDDLQARGLVSVRQPAGRELVHRFAGPARLLVATWRGDFPRRHRYPERRLSPTVANLVRACGRAILPTAVLTVGGAVAFGLLHLWRRGAGVGEVGAFVPLFLAIATCVAGYLAAAALTSVAHELAHLSTARLLRVPVRSVFVRFSLAGVTHGSTSPPRQALVAAAGGLAGFLVAAVLTVVLLVLPLHELALLRPLAVDVAVVLAGFVLMVLHLSSLLPVTGEGRRLWAAVARTVRPA